MDIDKERFIKDIKTGRGITNQEDKRFAEISILSCANNSWYKEQVGENIIACLVGYDLIDGTFIIKYAYSFESKGSKTVLKKPYSIIDITLT